MKPTKEQIDKAIEVLQAALNPYCKDKEDNFSIVLYTDGNVSLMNETEGEFVTEDDQEELTKELLR